METMPAAEKISGIEVWNPGVFEPERLAPAPKTRALIPDVVDLGKFKLSLTLRAVALAKMVDGRRAETPAPCAEFELIAEDSATGEKQIAVYRHSMTVGASLHLMDIPGIFKVTIT